MIEVPLSLEIEQELRATAAQMGLSVGAYFEHLLARQGAMPGSYRPSPELVEWRQRAVKSMLSLRDYMHADHQF